MEQFVTIGQQILRGIQVLGGITLGISLAITAYYFLSGSRQSSQMGKARIAGAVIGFILLMGSTAIQTWLAGFVNF